VSFSINFIYHDQSRKHLARTLHLTMIHKYSWHGTKLRDNKILHTYFITTWENDLSRCIAESANVHGLTFLSIVRGMQIFTAKSWLHGLSNVSVQFPYGREFPTHGIARGYSRLRRRATDGQAGGPLSRNVWPRSYPGHTTQHPRHAENWSSSVFLLSTIGIWLSPFNDNRYQFIIN